MGEKLDIIGTLYMQEADGEYKEIGEFSSADIITTANLDDGASGEHIGTIGGELTFSINDWGPWDKYNKHMFSVKRKGYKKRLNRLCKTVFGMTKVEFVFRKKKKRSRKRIRKHWQALEKISGSGLNKDGLVETMSSVKNDK